MSVTTFDSLAVACRLKAAGIEENQAEVIADSMREASGVNRDDFATKADFAVLQAQITLLKRDSKLSSRLRLPLRSTG